MLYIWPPQGGTRGGMADCYAWPSSIRVLFQCTAMYVKLFILSFVDVFISMYCLCSTWGFLCLSVFLSPFSEIQSLLLFSQPEAWNNVWRSSPSCFRVVRNTCRHSNLDLNATLYRSLYMYDALCIPFTPVEIAITLQQVEKWWENKLKVLDFFISFFVTGFFDTQIGTKVFLFFMIFVSSC